MWFSQAAAAFTLNVVDPNGAAIKTGYRWLVEEDVTSHPVPGQTSANILAFQFHKSWMPPVATGTGGHATPMADDIANWTPDPTKNYIITVVPDFTQDQFGTYFASYNLSSTLILAKHPDGNGQTIPAQTSGTVIVQPSPLIAGQIIVLAFEDNKPMNGEPDQDGERGLAGFSVRIDDGGGRYGQIGGQISVDVFGNPLGTTYMPDATNPSGYIIDPQTHTPTVQTVGTGTILTDANGYALIKNIPPGKYGVTLLPPNGSDWIQTSTIEGQHANDAWAKFHEPPFFAEFGPPGPHVFAGFISPSQSLGVLNPAGVGGTSVTGQITINHMNPPPHYGFNSGNPVGPALNGTSCYVGLNSVASNTTVAFSPCDATGNFSFAGVPPGDYTLGVFDTALDLIFGSYGFTVDPGAATCNNGTITGCALGTVPEFTWFSRIESKVFFDMGQTGFPGTGAAGIPEVPVTIKFRDGSTDQTFKSAEGTGIATFNETFPYFNWQVIEVDNARFKPTGVTVVVDGGGAVPPDSGWSMPSGGKLNPQPQYQTTHPTTQAKLAPSAWTPITNTSPGAGNNLSRTDKSTLARPITTQAFQGFTTGTNIIDFGKASYGPGENGGISGTVDYATVRAENDPQYAVSEGLEPGIPHVAVIVYPKPAPGKQLNLADIAAYDNTAADSAATIPAQHFVATLQTQILDNAAGKRKPAANATLIQAQGDVKRSTAGGATTFDYGDAIAYGWTDGWDDNLPTNCTNGYVPAGGTFTGEVYTTPTASAVKLDCYDGLRNWNQVRPGTYDGKYSITTTKTGTALPPGEYIVEVFAPRYGYNVSPYKIIKSEDKNVFFGVDFVPANVPPACVGSQQFINPNQYYYGAAGAATAWPAAPTDPATLAAQAVNPAYYPIEKVAYDPAKAAMAWGHTVPTVLSLFPVQDPTAPAPQGWPGGPLQWKPQPAGNKAAPLAGQTLPLCMFKDVTLAAGQNAKANYEFYTDVPIAAHFVGVILNDLGNEFDVAAPNFGEKQAPPWVPIAIRDSNGQELYRVYADEWGTYSGLVPSTITASVPIPTGNSPSVMTLCMNDPGPIKDPTDPAGLRTMIDPNFLKQFSQFCYTLAYLQGTTTYLDTPVVPVAAFTSIEVDQLDCDFVDGTPKVYSVVNKTNGIMGPVIPSELGANQTTVLTIVSDGNTYVSNPVWQGQGSGTPQKELRDYGFGRFVPFTTTAPFHSSVKIVSSKDQSKSVPISVSGSQWSNGIISLNVQPADFKAIAKLPGGSGELVITRGDNGKSTVMSVTVIANALTSQIHTVAAPVINPISNNSPTPITEAINSAQPGDVIVLPPGLYQEMVIMTKPVQIAGAGADSVAINPAKTRTDALQTWRNKVQALLTANPPAADLLPGQTLDFTIPEPGTLNTEEGAGIVVLGQAPTNPQGNMFKTMPSRIDGVKVFGADNGGGITINGYVHNLEISNNHVTTNAGAYGGGVRIGVPLLVTTDNAGNDIYTSGANENANIHHNSITTNGAQTTAGGGVQLCTGADNYKVQYNFICGNFAIGNGGGIGHEGLSNNGLIDHNTIIFNQVFDQTTNTNGGGISITSEVALAGATGQRSGTGSVVVSNNTIQGNQAGSGNGGGIYLEAVNGADVAANPGDPTKWFSVVMVNNMITNNQAGLGGGGIALQDVAQSAIINDTIANNESTSTAGAAFAPGKPYLPSAYPVTSTPHVAGILSVAHSPMLARALKGNGPLYAPFSNPDLRNDIIYENRSFVFRVRSGAPGDYGLVAAAKPNWDLGVVGTATPAQLSPSYSLLTAVPAGAGVGNISGDPAFHAAYFNSTPGTSVQALGFQQPEPTNGLPIVQPAFDEGGNFIDQVYWPLTQTVYTAANASTETQWSYVPKSTPQASVVACKGTSALLNLYGGVALTDFNGTTRMPCVDIGAAQQTP